MERCLLIADCAQSAQPLIECAGEAAPRVELDCIGAEDLPAGADYLLYILHLAGRPTDSLALVQRILARQSTACIAVCLPQSDRNTRHACLDAGAVELFDLPIDPPLCVSRLRHLVQLARQTRLVGRMQAQVQQRRELAWSHALELETEILRRLTNVSAHNDAITHKHQQRTAHLAGRIARRLGLSEHDANDLEQAAYLHDIGKIGIPTEVLCKVGRFNTRDRQIMSRHPVIGNQILRDGKTPTLTLGASIALHHHERFDGSGYPHGLTGRETPLAARIAAVADVFDSLTEQRRYNRTRSANVALQQLELEVSRGVLDPDCVRALGAVIDEDGA